MFGQIGVYNHQLDWDGLGLVNYQSSLGLTFNSTIPIPIANGLWQPWHMYISLPLALLKTWH